MGRVHPCFPRSSAGQGPPRKACLCMGFQGSKRHGSAAWVSGKGGRSHGPGHGSRLPWVVVEGMGVPWAWRASGGHGAGPAQMNNVGPRRACAARVPVCYILPALAAVAAASWSVCLCLSASLHTSLLPPPRATTVSSKSPDVHAPALTSRLWPSLSCFAAKGLTNTQQPFSSRPCPPFHAPPCRPDPSGPPTNNPPHRRPEQDIIELSAPPSAWGKTENRI